MPSRMDLVEVVRREHTAQDSLDIPMNAGDGFVARFKKLIHVPENSNPCVSIDQGALFGQQTDGRQFGMTGKK